MTAAETPRTYWDEAARIAQALAEVGTGSRTWNEWARGLAPAVEEIVTDRLAAAVARAEAAEAKVAAVEALLASWEWNHHHLGIERGNWGPSSHSLRAALGSATTEEADQRCAPGRCVLHQLGTGRDDLDYSEMTDDEEDDRG